METYRNQCGLGSRLLVIGEEEGKARDLPMPSRCGVEEEQYRIKRDRFQGDWGQ